MRLTSGGRQAVGLEEKADCAAGTLSGGSKRKLQVGIALLADSRVVLLDEPSSGVTHSADGCGFIYCYKYHRSVYLNMP